jgi:hypothetical protein
MADYVGQVGGSLSSVNLRISDPTKGRWDSQFDDELSFIAYGDLLSSVELEVGMAGFFENFPRTFYVSG